MRFCFEKFHTILLNVFNPFLPCRKKRKKKTAAAGSSERGGGKTEEGKRGPSCAAMAISPQPSPASPAMAVVASLAAATTATSCSATSLVRTWDLGWMGDMIKISSPAQGPVHKSLVQGPFFYVFDSLRLCRTSGQRLVLATSRCWPRTR